MRTKISDSWLSKRTLSLRSWTKSWQKWEQSTRRWCRRCIYLLRMKLSRDSLQIFMNEARLMPWSKAMARSLKCPILSPRWITISVSWFTITLMRFRCKVTLSKSDLEPNHQSQKSKRAIRNGPRNLEELMRELITWDFSLKKLMRERLKLKISWPSLRNKLWLEKRKLKDCINCTKEVRISRNSMLNICMRLTRKLLPSLLTK